MVKWRPKKPKNVIRIPDFDPRPYQLDFLQAMDSGLKRAVLIWHRRAGKEISCWNYLIREACCGRTGTYVYFFPTSRLGRRILWDGSNKDGRRFIDYIPTQLIEGKPNSVEMRVTLKNGSVIQIMGTDQIINVGINPIGCVFSEYSIQDPKTWNFVRPILRENDGWAVFNFTPRGRNHAYDLYLMANDNPDWFCQKLTIEDTGVLTYKDMEIERQEGMSQHLIQQEYYCNFDQGQEGSYYAKYLTKAELAGRITHVEYDPYCPVDSYWDIGVSDSTAIIFAQRVGQELHIIDHYEAQGEGLNHYARILKQKEDHHTWQYGTHYAPHDIRVREFAGGARTRLEMARELGINFEIVPNMPVQEGIEMVRGIFHRLWIDKKNCTYLLKCIENYHKHFNERLNVYSDKPVHDWSSHSCFVKDTMIFTDKGPVAIQDIEIGDRVKTPMGYRKVLNTFRKSVKKVITVNQGGASVTCTPDHKFFTDHGLIPADAIEYAATVYTSEDKWKNTSNYRGETSGFRENFLLKNVEIALSTTDMSIGGMGVTTEEDLLQKTLIQQFLGLSGHIIMVKFLKGITYITKTIMDEITRFLIWRPFLQANTEDYICRVRKERKNPDQQLQKLLRQLQSGMPVQKGLPGIKNTHKILDLAKIPFRWCVQNVTKSSLGKYIIKSFAPLDARLRAGMHPELITNIGLVQSVETNFQSIDTQKRRRAPKNVPQDLQSHGVIVHDIEIEDDHCYYANGFLVSNCDAFRYMAIAYNRMRTDRMTEEQADDLQRQYMHRS